MPDSDDAPTRAEDEHVPDPGWYPDPWSAAPVRWWDGRRWTEHIAERRARRRAS